MTGEKPRYLYPQWPPGTPEGTFALCILLWVTWGVAIMFYCNQMPVTGTAVLIVGMGAFTRYWRYKAKEDRQL